MTQTPAPETYFQRKARLEGEKDGLNARGSRLARKLLSLYIIRASAQGPKAKAVAHAAFEGACMALAAEHGWTETAYQLAVIGPWQTYGGPPVIEPGLGGGIAHATWRAEISEAIDAELSKLMGD